MLRYYDTIVTPVPMGFAVEHRSPRIAGTVVAAVSDMVNADQRRLIVCECDDEQHRGNAAVPGIRELTEAEGVALAAQYQPQRTVKRIDPQTQKVEETVIPALDLRQYLGGDGTIAIGGDLLSPGGNT